MYLRAIEISNIRSLKKLAWRLPDGQRGPGWHVILGDNGAGKSSFMQAVSLALVGPSEAPALRQDFNQWLRADAAHGDIQLDVEPSEIDLWRERGGKDQLISPRIRLERSKSDARLVEVSAKNPLKKGPYRGLWTGSGGWFSAGFGPFRRFQGGDSDTSKLFYSNPRLARHLSMFSEGVALTECLAWLCKQRTRTLEQQSAGEAPASSYESLLLGYLKGFINDSGLLPNGVQLKEVNSETVVFRDADGQDVPVMALSDGFRTTLSLTFELLRLMVQSFGLARFMDNAKRKRAGEGTSPYVSLPGVVLIDEVDAHLHPTWQHRIGEWFKRSFPNVQFLVTTHSPIICQAAAGGSVFKLPQPGTDEEARMFQGMEFKRLVYGTVLDAYRTSAFDADATRSDAARELLDELASLNVKEIAEGLDDTERQRQEELRTILPGRDPQRPEL